MGCFASKPLPGVVRPQMDFFEEYELSSVLGRGAFGTVYLVHSVESREKLAVKVRVPVGQKRHLPRDVIMEQRAWAFIGAHPNVVEFRKAFFDGCFAYLVMELCTGSLFTAWMNEPDLNEYTYVRYFKDMAQALAHIHSVGVVHRDVKQDNFMVGGPDGRTVKLCDFGLSARVGKGSMSGLVGTAPYFAPEMLTYGGKHGPPVDVWAFGVIVYTAFYGRWPYQPRIKSNIELLNVIRDGTVPPSFTPARRFSQNVVSETGIRFVKALLDRNPQTRPNAAACLAMSYLHTIRCDQLQANGDMSSFISLVPELTAGRRCGAFAWEAPKADAGQQRLLMKLQSVAQLKRELYLTSRSEAKCSATSTLDDMGMDPMPRRPEQHFAQDLTRRTAKAT